ncbi:MAG: hypothetical protein QOF79_3062 [Actinomycetota bacterium]|nr:hypothetical protein [Actinomycetota bacterium]
MTSWTTDELDKIGAADELHVASRRADGTLRPEVTIWAVRVADDLFVRSAHGSDNPWYRRALASGVGRIRAGEVERDVTFEHPSPGDPDAIDAAYHAKYDRYGARVVNPVVGAHSHDVTIRVLPK